MDREFLLGEEERKRERKLREKSEPTKEDKYRRATRQTEYDSAGRRRPSFKTMVCVWCGVEFWSRFSTAKYCTQWCRRRGHYHTRKKAGVCPRCGGPQDREGTYCIKCNIKHRNRFDNNNGTPGIPEDGKCVRCGRTKDSPKKLHWHHIILREISQDDTLENLILLCGKCHNNVRGETFRFLLKYFIESVGNMEEARKILKMLIESKGGG